MKFKDLKVNDLLYSFNESNITYNKLVVTKVSPPRIDSNILGVNVVDINVNGENSTLVFKSEDSYGNCKDVYYTTDFNSLINRIRSVSLSIQDKLNEVDKLKSNKKSCDNLLAELDPIVKERQKSEKRLSELESKFTTLSSDISEIKDFIKKLASKEKKD